MVAMCCPLTMMRLVINFGWVPSMRASAWWMTAVGVLSLCLLPCKRYLRYLSAPSSLMMPRRS